MSQVLHNSYRLCVLTILKDFYVLISVITSKCHKSVAFSDPGTLISWTIEAYICVTTTAHIVTIFNIKYLDRLYVFANHTTTYHYFLTAYRAHKWTLSWNLESGLRFLKVDKLPGDGLFIINTIE